MTSVGNIARVAKDRALASRSIRVLVTPTPITFAERRSVLQVLEQYGPIEVFKMTPGYYSNFISVTREPATASQLVESSPLIYNVTEPSRPAAEDIYVADLAEPESFDILQPSIVDQPDASPLSEQDSLQGASTKHQFQLEIFPAPEFNHRFAMQGSPLHGPWPKSWERDNSFVANALKQSLPTTIVGTGLAHWLFSTSSNTRIERKAKRLQLKSLLPSEMKNSNFEKPGNKESS